MALISGVDGGPVSSYGATKGVQRWLLWWFFVGGRSELTSCLLSGRRWHRGRLVVMAVTGGAESRSCLPSVGDPGKLGATGD